MFEPGRKMVNQPLGSMRKFKFIFFIRQKMISELGQEWIFSYFSVLLIILSINTSTLLEKLQQQKLERQGYFSQIKLLTEYLI